MNERGAKKLLAKIIAGELAGYTAADGTRHGDRIPGSEWRRSFCYRCGEPMRVKDPARENYCGDCAPRQPPPAHYRLTPAQRQGCRKTDS